MFLFHEAAGRVSGTAGLGVAHVLSWMGNSLAKLLLQGWDLLQPGHTEATGFVTGALCHIALVAFGAAVLVIVAAHSLERNKERVLHHRLKSFKTSQAALLLMKQLNSYPHFI